MAQYEFFKQESIFECFIQDQAFSLLNDLAPPPPLSYQLVVSLSQSSCVSPVELTDYSR